MNEKEYTKHLTKLLLRLFQVYSFEEEAPKSTPDLHLVHRKDGKSFWVEAKVAPIMGPVKFQAGQADWLTNYRGEAFVVVFLGERLWAYERKYALALSRLPWAAIPQDWSFYRGPIKDFPEALSEYVTHEK